MSSYDGWELSLFLNDGFIFGGSLDMTLSTVGPSSVDQEASAEEYRLQLEEILRKDVLPGAKVEVLICWGEEAPRHHIEAPVELSQSRKAEIANRVYAAAYDLWRTQGWVVPKKRPPSGAQG